MTYTTYLPSVHTQDTPLAYLLQDHGILYGTCIWPSLDDAHTDALRAEYTAVMPENAMKMGDVWLDPDTMDWGLMDSTAAIADETGNHLIGAPLVWCNSIPEWLFGYTSAGISAVMRRYIQEAIKRYPHMLWINVVNEAYNLDGSTRICMWHTADSNYVETAFRVARETLDSLGIVGAKLFYNDYHFSQNILDQFLRLHQLGLVDGFGFQAHYHDGFPEGIDYEDITILAHKLADEGAAFLVTEMDVAMTDIPTTFTDALFSAQAEVYQEMLRICLNDAPTCAYFGTWGMCDNYSWKEYALPLVFGSNLQRKPAYDRMRGLFRMVP